MSLFDTSVGYAHYVNNLLGYRFGSHNTSVLIDPPKRLKIEITKSNHESYSTDDKLPEKFKRRQLRGKKYNVGQTSTDAYNPVYTITKMGHLIPVKKHYANNQKRSEPRHHSPHHHTDDGNEEERAAYRSRHKSKLEEKGKGREYYEKETTYNKQGLIHHEYDSLKDIHNGPRNPQYASKGSYNHDVDSHPYPYDSRDYDPSSHYASHKSRGKGKWGYPKYENDYEKNERGHGRPIHHNYLEGYDGDKYGELSDKGYGDIVYDNDNDNDENHIDRDYFREKFQKTLKENKLVKEKIGKYNFIKHASKGIAKGEKKGIRKGKYSHQDTHSYHPDLHDHSQVNYYNGKKNENQQKDIAHHDGNSRHLEIDSRRSYKGTTHTLPDSRGGETDQYNVKRKHAYNIDPELTPRKIGDYGNNRAYRDKGKDNLKPVSGEYGKIDQSNRDDKINDKHYSDNGGKRYLIDPATYYSRYSDYNKRYPKLILVKNRDLEVDKKRKKGQELLNLGA
ncbi:unnamed protein product [Gordionus sp. m RMFG-2023]